MTDYRNYDDAAWQLNDKQKQFFTEIETELKVPVTVICGRSQRMERPDDVEGLVFIDYSTNSESPTPRRIDAIARSNHTTVQLKNSYLLKPDDREHIFDFNGFPLCEIRMGTLWGLTPLQNFDTVELMKEFFADAMRMAMNEKFFKEKEEQRKRAVREAFMNAMKASNQTEVRDTKKEVKSLTEQLAGANDALINTQATLIRAEQRLEIATRLAEGDEEAYNADIASLMRHTQIKKIDYDTQNAILQIYTHLLYIYSPSRKERAPLGEFVIKVNTKNNNSVTIFNLTNKKSHKMHPHVEENGAACWGAIGTQIAKLAATCKIEGLADAVIRYLETYNVQDGNARYAAYWFTEKATQKRRSDFENQWMNEEEYKESSRAQKEMVEAGKEKETVKEVSATITEKDLQKA